MVAYLQHINKKFKKIALSELLTIMISTWLITMPEWVES